MQAAVAHAMLSVIRKTTGHLNLYCRIFIGDDLCQLVTVHIGHHYIAEHKIDVIGVE